ncbi:winged helix-turn-helix domain-containing protein [Buttiauxella selenatireducens]|uniref:Winged helix-turn-helix domain-containing protein n=1 Tax=Buttiauxella selenatireducens TaxID=3073902 RepID=A0ABY9S8Q7_9ENTR|nr:winged helix-turn-helix domain-containing protein [Buttiauxella sp. R73]WMY73541.1 winged helix-turn-helix domain-containing protein [Buttiauxella sp. R73]
MMKAFIINHSVRFDPRSRTLAPLEKPENKVQLHTPVSECLLLLLTHNGETLSHSYLSEEVWVKKGSYVTPNSLYQNIAAIRRGLKAVGLSEEMLKTVPKMGFQIYASLQEEELLPAESEGRTNDVLKGENGTEENHEPEPHDEIISEPTIEKSNTGFFGAQVNAFYLALAILFTFGCVHFYIQLGSINDPYSSYSHIGMINNCDVYSSYVGKEESSRVFNSFLIRSALSCQLGSKAYLTFNLNHRLSSLVLCDQSINNKNSYCRSFIYVDNKNDD